MQDTELPLSETSDAEDAQPPLAAFESSITELESLVETLESGEVPLEDALARFERGITLARQCQTMLKSAELRVDQLVGDGDEAHVTPFSSTGTADDDQPE